MNKKPSKIIEPSEAKSLIFNSQEIETFKRIFTKLAKGGEEVNLIHYINHVKQISKNKENTVMSVIVKDLEGEGEMMLNFKDFIAILEEKVGNLNTSSGLQRIFTFITKDPTKKEVNLEDLKSIKEELGLNVSEKELQRLINFVTSSYKERKEFNFEEFEKYALRA